MCATNIWYIHTSLLLLYTIQTIWNITLPLDKVYKSLLFATIKYRKYTRGVQFARDN